MRISVTAILLELLLALAASGAEPQFVVENKTAAFVVVDKTGCPCDICTCVPAPGGVGTCGSYRCAANGGKVRNCICGDSCKCEEGKCPAKCPVVPGTIRTASGRLIKQNGAGGWVYADEPAQASGVVTSSGPRVIGYRYQRVCEGGVCRVIAVPVYER